MLQRIKIKEGELYTKSMGLYDTIEDELFCPFCGAKCKGFQSKDIGDNLTNWTIQEIETYFDRKDVIEIYDFCENCKKFISINLKGGFKDNLQKLVGEKLKKIKNERETKTT